MKSRPPYVYHGTTIEKWAERHEGDTVLWLAEDHARASQYMGSENPLLLKFSLPDLIDAGLICQLKDTTRYNMTLIVRGDVESAKHLGQIMT